MLRVLLTGVITLTLAIITIILECKNSHFADLTAMLVAGGFVFCMISIMML